HALVDRAQGLADRRTRASRAVVRDDRELFRLALAFRGECFGHLGPESYAGCAFPQEDIDPASTPPRARRRCFSQASHISRWTSASSTTPSQWNRQRPSAKNRNAGVSTWLNRASVPGFLSTSSQTTVSASPFRSARRRAWLIITRSPMLHVR